VIANEVNEKALEQTNGYGFGKNQTPKTKVAIGNLKAEIVSRNDKQMRIKIDELTPNKRPK